MILHCHRTLSVIVCAVVTAAALACGREGSAGEAVTTTDSAGVVIVENPAPRWAEGEAWQVSPTATVTIGVAEGEPAYLLTSIRGALRLADGRILVGDGRTRDLRFFDSSGRHLRTAGGRGEGPGELAEIVALERAPGDSIAVYDRQLGRGSLFDSGGGFSRSFRISPPDGWLQPAVRRIFQDGSLLVSSQEGFETPRLGAFETGSWVFSRFGPDGGFLGEVARGKIGTTWGFDRDGQLNYTYLPFVLVTPLAAADSASVYVGHGAAFEVEERDLTGRLIRVIRWAGESKPVTEELIAEYKSARIAGASLSYRPMIERYLAEIPFPSEMPAYQGLLVDALGYLWVEQYRPRDRDEDVRWWVFDEDGAWLGEVQLPEGLRVRDIGEDYILGTWLDDLDVEHVSQYRLIRK